MKVLIPMAGAGSRFAKAGYQKPKPLIEALGKSLIEWSIESFKVDADFIFVTRNFGDEVNAQLKQELERLVEDPIIIESNKLTRGAAETALLAQEYIDSDEELVIYNCDQYIDWEENKFLESVRSQDCDAAVVLYTSSDPKNSFARIERGYVTEIVEKQVISDNALVGFHYWKRGRLFVDSAKKLINEFQSNGRPECYVSETFSYLKEGTTIAPYFITSQEYQPLGTPEDLEHFVGEKSEYNGEQRPTSFIDIDGTLVKHMHSISSVYKKPASALEGVLKKMNEWDSKGYYIVLVTARKESARGITVQQLESLGIAWDELVMGVSGGKRYLVNDIVDEKEQRACAINVIKDAGFNQVEWSKYGL